MAINMAITRLPKLSGQAKYFNETNYIHFLINDKRL